MNKLYFYYDYGSPASYLAWTQVEKNRDKGKYQIIDIPILLGGIFKLTGNNPPGDIKAKGNYMRKDLVRYASKYQENYKFNDYFPINTLNLMRGSIAADSLGIKSNYDKCIFKGIWSDNKDLSNIEILKDHLSLYNLDAKKIFELVQKQEIKDKLIKNTSNAVAIGIFGAPSFVLENELFFGQDRMSWFFEGC